MAEVAVIDARDITVTPIFRHMEIENIPKSEEQGRLVKETHEVVQVRFAGSNNYSPIFPATAFYKREGNNVITYAERWADQYRQFKEGNPQEARGTPLEMLVPYGITPNEQSLCRTMKIYSVEALDQLEGTNLKNIGMNGNKLKEMARKYLSDRSSNKTLMDENAELKARLAALEGKAIAIPLLDPSEVEDLDFDAMSEDQLRSYIEAKTGNKCDGRWAKDRLVNMAKGM